MDKNLEREVACYQERYGAVDVARIFGKMDMTIEELERIDYLVDTLELEEIKSYMMETYSGLYTEMIECLEKEPWEKDSFDKMKDRYESWKSGVC